MNSSSMYYKTRTEDRKQGKIKTLKRKDSNFIEQQCVDENKRVKTTCYGVDFLWDFFISVGRENKRKKVRLKIPFLSVLTLNSMCFVDSQRVREPTAF